MSETKKEVEKNTFKVNQYFIFFQMKRSIYIYKI